MGSESTSKFEVKNPKSRKRTKKKHKSKDVTNKTNSNIDTSKYDTNQAEEVNKHNIKYKKLKERKHKLNTINDTNEKIKDNEEENNFAEMKENQDEEESSEEEVSPKKKTKIHMENAINDMEESDKNDIKISKQLSKRKLKLDKAEKRVNEKKLASKLEAMEKGLNYVSKWKHARTEWKFEKLKQIWLIDNLLDETSIPEDIFPTVLEYFEGCKGMAREQLLKKGMDIIRKVEENEENKDEVKSIAYQRARKLLQALPTDT